MDTKTIMMNKKSKRHLDFDILVYIGQCIPDRDDLLSFISTCSDLYRTGIPTLLKIHCRITRTNLVAFYEFLASKSPSSFLGLRSLELHFPEYAEGHVNGKTGPNEITMITDILDHAKKLLNLKIHGSIMGSGATIYRALAALPALDSLNLDMSGDFDGEIFAALAQIQSPLVGLRCDLQGEDGDLVATLSNFCHTLEGLAALNTTLSKVATTDLRYYNMSHLELVSVSNMRLSILIPAFPNLKLLAVRFADHFNDLQVDPLRADNLQFQQEHPGQTWRLSSLEADIPGLYVLGLQTAVYTVSIDCLGVTARHETAEFLEAVLMPLCPLSLSVDELDDSVLETGWLSDAVKHCHKLARFDFELLLQDTQPICENEDQLDFMFAQLARAFSSNPNLVFLCINILPDSRFKLGSPNGSRPAVPCVNNLDMRVLATRARDAVPTLKMFKFMIEYDADEPELCSYWIYQDDGELKEVPAESHNDAQIDLNKRTESLIEAYDRLLMEPSKTD